MSREQAERYATVVGKVFTQGSFPCGSFRRGKNEIGDLDIAVVPSTDTSFTQQVAKVIAELNAIQIRGGEKMVVLNSPEGHQIDLYNTDPEYLGSMMLFLTGSAKHNIKLRAKAKYKGMSLSQYGLMDAEDRTVLASKTEEDIFSTLGVKYTPPAKR